ncbi:MAG: hypothetical protein HON43_04850 [Alphaproteobacteria bacterium]|nr:hypothetical protein [Alphaproteobacteria bacterium]MBT5389243.1 hypothetical protein [Alphaproteobacteria bacterium]
MPTHSKAHRLKTPVRLEFLGSGKTEVELILAALTSALELLKTVFPSVVIVFPAIRNSW